MTWFRVDTGLVTHRKVRSLMRQLRVGQAEAVGLVCGFLAYVTDNAEDGDVSHLDWADAADWVGWRKGDMRETLVAVGFVDVDEDGSMHAHDYDDWNGKLVERRQKDRERKADVRRTKRGRLQDVRNLSDPTTRHDTERHGTNNGVGKEPAFPTPTPTLRPSKDWTDEERAAAKEWRTEHASPAAFDALVRGCAEERLTGGGFGWPVVGRALLEMRAAVPRPDFNIFSLQGYCRKVRDRVPEQEETEMVSDGLKSVLCRAVDGWWVAVATGERIAEVVA